MISLSLNSLWEYYEASVTLNRRKNVGRILNHDRNSYNLVQLTYFVFLLIMINFTIITTFYTLLHSQS